VVCSAVVAAFVSQLIRQSVIALISTGIFGRIAVRKVLPNDLKAVNGKCCKSVIVIKDFKLTFSGFRRYCTMSDWIQFEETENSDEKRLNFFETQAKEKSEKDGDRNGDESSP